MLNSVVNIGQLSVAMNQLTYVCVMLCRVTDPEMPLYGEPPTGVWRRYSEFELLRSYLDVTFPAIVVPPLPEKRVCHSFRCFFYNYFIHCLSIFIQCGCFCGYILPVNPQG